MERHLAAALIGVARAGQGQVRASGLDPCDETLAQGNGLGAQRIHVDLVPDVQCGVQRGHLQYGRRADAHPFDAAPGTIIVIKGERRLMPQPARQGRAHRTGVTRRDIDKGRRAGACIQVFIGAADREIGVAGGQMHRKCPRRMGQIPDHHRADIVRRSGQGRHVVAPPSAIIDLGQHHDGDIFGDVIGHLLGCDTTQVVALVQ